MTIKFRGTEAVSLDQHQHAAEDFKVILEVQDLRGPAAEAGNGGAPGLRLEASMELSEHTTI